MKLPKFAYVEPGDLDEATAMLHDEPASKILAGGTDILVNMKHRVERPALLVNIKRPVSDISKAIANAIYDAIGVDFMELPITPEKILDALKGKAKKEK